MAELKAQLLLETETVAIRDVACRGECRHIGEEECACATQLVFPYRGSAERLKISTAAGRRLVVFWARPDIGHFGEIRS